MPEWKAHLFRSARCDHGEVSYNKVSCFHWIKKTDLLLWTARRSSMGEKYQTSTRSWTLTPTEDLESHHRGQMKEGQHRKTRIRHKHHIYVHIQWSKKNTHTYTSEIWLAFDNFQKVNVCICFYTKYNFFFKTIFWVVQFFFFRFKLVDYFHKQFACEKQKDPLLPFSQYYTNCPELLC